jgi:ABC-2 type transport system permease protein
VSAHAYAERRERSAWTVVAEEELRALWLGGRALLLVFGFSLLLSLIAYLAATTTDLNFLERRESVSLTLQVAIGVGSLLALLIAADAVSGERERGTLESVLVTPASRLDLAAGKFVAALSLWLAAYVIAIPYLWFLGRGIGATDEALVSGLVVGTLLAVFLGSLGLLISVFANSNRVSLALGLFLLLVLFAPTQLPTAAEKGWFGEFLLRANPVTAGERYVGRIVVEGRGWTDELSWLLSPLLGAVVFAVAAALVSARYLRLRGGGS